MAPADHFIGMRCSVDVKHRNFSQRRQPVMSWYWQGCIQPATTTKVEEKKVTYVDAGGNEHIIDADSVVICGGMDALRDEALAFASPADRFFIVGDCNSVGNVQKSVREGFAAASRL